MSASQSASGHGDAPAATAARADAQRVTTRPRGARLLTLRELRVDEDLSLADLAERSGVNKGTLSQIERGRIVATPAELASIGMVFGRQLEVRTLPVYEEQS